MGHPGYSWWFGQLILLMLQTPGGTPPLDLANAMIQMR